LRSKDLREPPRAVTRKRAGIKRKASFLNVVPIFLD
jgi:hypothetical protein